VCTRLPIQQHLALHVPESEVRNVQFQLVGCTIVQHDGGEHPQGTDAIEYPGFDAACQSEVVLAWRQPSILANAISRQRYDDRLHH
jgi:hypothetical protein